jgi:uncharacterized protein (DUF433 family)
VGWGYEEEIRVHGSREEIDEETGPYFVSFGEHLVLQEVIIGARFKLSKQPIEDALQGYSDVKIVKLRTSTTKFEIVVDERGFDGSPEDILDLGTAMLREYVEKRNDGYYVRGTRVSLDSVVYAFLRGESSDGIADSFPALSLEQVYGAIAFYLAHRKVIDNYLQEGKAEFARLRDESRLNHPQLYAKLDAARERTPAGR